MVHGLVHGLMPGGDLRPAVDCRLMMMNYLVTNSEAIICHVKYLKIHRHTHDNNKVKLRHEWHTVKQNLYYNGS